MTVFNFELKAKLKTVLYWSLSISAVNIFYFAFFPVISKEAKLFDELMNQFPPEFLAAFGLGGLSMSSVEGYTGLLLTFGALLTSVFAANVGFSILTREESEATADFLFSKPISRLRIFVSKFLVSIIAIFVVSTMFIVSMYVSILMFKGDTNPDIGLLLYSLTSVYFISYFFFGVSLVISTFLKKVKNVISLSLGLTFLLYSLNAFTQAIESDSNFSWNPYTLFEFNQIYMDEKIAFGAIAYVLGVLAVATAVSFIRYQKHNISSL